MTVETRGAELLGRTLGGRYHLDALIGTGASAGVYSARDTRLGRPVAVKVLHPGVAADPAFQRRFRAEARSAAALSHPHIVAVHDWGEDDGAYLVTELLDGGSLGDVLASGSRLSVSQALLVGVQAARGLDHAHRHGLVHRDVKPANLLFGRDARLRIADFGIARAVAEAAWTEPDGVLVGTARYAAPEQATAGPIDGRADVYALALTLVEAVTGEVPLTGDTPLATMALRQGAPIPVPAELGPLAGPLAAAGAVDPAERPTAAVLADALLAAAADLERPAPLPLAGLSPATAASPAVDPHPTSDARTVLGAPAGAVFDVEQVDDGDGPPSPAPAPRRRRRRWPWALAVLALLAAAAAGVWWQWERTRTPTHEVGNYVGAAVEAVRAEAELNGWLLVERPDRADGTDAGEVLDQAPPPGSRLEEGAELAVVVSQGQLLHPVPEVTGMPVAEATAALAEASLEVGATTGVHDEDVPAGHVVSASVPAGTEVETGTAVDLVVSDGPAPRTVPDLLGSAPADAVAALEGLGLVVELAEEHSDDVPEGAIISIDPAPGQQVERGGTVSVVVSLGRPFVAVPDVVGLGAAEASDRLEGAGFVVVDTIGPPNRPVLTTDPPAGELHRKGRAVTVITRSS